MQSLMNDVESLIDLKIMSKEVIFRVDDADVDGVTLLRDGDLADVVMNPVVQPPNVNITPCGSLQ